MTTALLTAGEVADRLRESKQNVMRRLRSGELRGFKSGKQWLIDETDVQKYLDARVNFTTTDARRRRR
jgi:excisionase family DNA binding protein